MRWFQVQNKIKPLGALKFCFSSLFPMCSQHVLIMFPLRFPKFPSIIPFSIPNSTSIFCHKWFCPKFNSHCIHKQLKRWAVWGAKQHLLLPQANGCACVDVLCTHPIDGLFWNLPTYLLGNWFNHASLSFYFFGLSLAFLYHEVSYHYKMF
jgi:hypothetical protein